MDTRERIKLHFTEDDVFDNTKWFKTHREFIEAKFKQLGFEVTLWNWDRDFMGRWQSYPDGIQFMRDDSDTNLSFEVTGIVGVNLRRIESAARVEIQSSSAEAPQRDPGSVVCEDPAGSPQRGP